VIVTVPLSVMLGMGDSAGELASFLSPRQRLCCICPIAREGVMSSFSLIIGCVSFGFVTLAAGLAASEALPVPSATIAESGHVTQLVLEIVNQRGVPANQEVGLEIRLFGGRVMNFPNINQSLAWRDGSRITQFIAISPSVPLEDILEVVLFKRRGDPWIVSSLRIRAVGPNGLNRLIHESSTISVAPGSVRVLAMGGWMWLDVVPGRGGLAPRQEVNLIVTYPQREGGLNSHLFVNINGGAAWEANRAEKILLQLPQDARGVRWERPERLYLFNATAGRDAIPIPLNAIRVTVRMGSRDHILFPAPPQRGVARTQPIALPVLMLVPTVN
jgi:hypothetical protein